MKCASYRLLPNPSFERDAAKARCPSTSTLGHRFGVTLMTDFFFALPIVLVVTATVSLCCSVLGTGKAQFHAQTATVYFISSLCVYFFLVSGWLKSFGSAPNLLLLGSYVIFVLGSFVAFFQLSKHRHRIVVSIFSALALGTVAFIVTLVSYMVFTFAYLLTGLSGFHDS